MSFMDIFFIRALPNAAWHAYDCAFLPPPNVIS